MNYKSNSNFVFDSFPFLLATGNSFAVMHIKSQLTEASHKQECRALTLPCSLGFALWVENMKSLRTLDLRSLRKFWF